jgi:predicted lipid-binding transport protein (Tim44 family)
MKMLSLLAAMLTLGFALHAGDAEAAKRLGGGKSFGMQRQATPPAAAPAQAAPSMTKPAAPAATPPAAAPGRSWMGPLAGLAAGIGLAALASHFGFGEELASMMMIALLAMIVMAVIAYVMRRRAGGATPAMAGAGGMQYSGQGEPQPGASPKPYNLAMPGSSLNEPAAAPAQATASSIPADFDVAGFVRNAKVNFIRLQAANDSGNLDDLREFTTPEMFAELKMNIDERTGATQHTDVLNINADVLEVAEETNRYVVSVHFTGQIREEANGPAESFDEIWHLTKPRDGKTGWLLAGIQQRH